MAAIPTYFLFGDKQILGQTRGFMEADVELGIPPTKAYTLRKAIPSLMQNVPSQANGDPMSPETYRPWWDGQYVDGALTGVWAVYHHVDGGSGGPLANAGGDNWYAATAGTSTYPTFGPTISLMQFLKQRHGLLAPGFKFYKRTFANAITGESYGTAGANGWGAIAGASWTGFLSDLSTMRSRLTGGDTLDLKGIILDGASVDIGNGTSAATYKTALQTLITRIRAAEGGATQGLAYSGLIILVNPDANLYKTSRAGLASAYRAVHAELAANATAVAAYNNIRIVEMAGASFAPADVTSYDNEDPDPDMYSSDEYISLGYRIGVTIESFYKSAPVADPGSGIATYFLIGDSQAKGQINPVVALFGAQATILGPYNPASPGSATRNNQYIWNGVTNLIEPYSVLTNANTLPASEYTTDYFGPEATFMKKLAETHGDNGFLVIKMAKNGAALTSESVAAGASDSFGKAENANNLYVKLIEAWNRVKIDMVTPRTGWPTPRIPDVRGIAVLLGDNDTYTEACAAAFAAKVGTFVTNLCADFRTRTDRTTVPIAWHKVPKGNAEGGQSGLGNQTARTAVRSAQISLAASRSTYLSIAETDNLELRRDETPKVHYGGEANYEIGYRLAAALLSLSATGGATGTTTGGEDTGEDGPAPEAATLVVEDGSGLTNANSYASLAYADSYHEYHRNPATWTEADDADKEQALRMATWWLDQTYGDRWIGLKSTQEQALDWPRGLAYDRNGYQVPDDEVPNRLKDATCEMALRYLLAPDELMPDVEVQDQGILSESNAVGALSSSTTYAGGKSYEKRFTAAYRLLTTSGLIEGGNWANR